MVVTRPEQSSKVEFLDTTTGEVVTCMDLEYGGNMDIAFSPDEDQVAFLSESLTICDIMHLEKHISFDPWPRKIILGTKVAFQTCNNLVVCGISCDDHSALLQVWHRQDPIGFECMYVFFRLEGRKRLGPISGT